jgi:hypothetical protein
MRTVEEHIRLMWENDHLPWCKEIGHDPGTFEDYSEQLRPQITEEDLNAEFRKDIEYYRGLLILQYDSEAGYRVNFGTMRSKLVETIEEARQLVDYYMSPKDELDRIFEEVPGARDWFDNAAKAGRKFNPEMILDQLVKKGKAEAITIPKDPEEAKKCIMMADIIKDYPLKSE